MYDHPILRRATPGGAGGYVGGLESEKVNLTFRDIVRTLYHDAPMADQRRRLTVVTVAYQDEDGHEYRKAFESYGYPDIPKSGTHKEINSKRKQWV